MNQRLPGNLVHFDISGPDARPLSRFYQELFAWKIAPKGPGYSLVETPEGSPNGALIEAENASLTIGIVVADLEAALRQAVSLGGRILLPAVDNGWVRKAQIADPAGNAVTLLQG